VKFEQQIKKDPIINAYKKLAEETKEKKEIKPEKQVSKEKPDLPKKKPVNPEIKVNIQTKKGDQK